MMWRTGLTAAVFGFLAGLVGVWCGLAAFGGTEQDERSIHEIIHEKITLTAAQTERIHALEEAFAAERAEIDTRMSQARREIGDALLADHTLSPDVTAAADRFHTSMGELQLASLTHVLAMRAELEPEQQALFDAQLARSFDVAD